MTVKKNQHFVPKLYLKAFSTEKDNVHIGLYNLDNQIFRAKVPLKSQAKEDYFYGKDGFFEEELSKLETLAAPFIKSIIETNDLPVNSSEEYKALYTFSMVLAYRTKNAAEQLNEMTDKLFKTMMMYDERLKDNIENHRIHYPNPAAVVLANISNTLPLGLDLKLKLLINKTDVPFITSDDPVIRYNQFLEQRKHPGGHVGIVAKGLQVFFPISPTKMLFFYDDLVYKIGDRKKNVVELRYAKDIHHLNRLQAINCYSQLFFNEQIQEHYIKDLTVFANKLRETEYSIINLAGSNFDKDGNEHIFYNSQNLNIKMNLDLSFVTLTKSAKQHVLSDYLVQFRSEKLREMHRQKNQNAEPLYSSFSK